MCDILLKKFALNVHLNAKLHGWWDDRDTKKGVANESIPTLICLIHSEASEALEAYRHQNDANFAEEMADIIIRVLDTCEGLGIDICEALNRKHKINEARPHRHGGKRC